MTRGLFLAAYLMFGSGAGVYYQTRSPESGWYAPLAVAAIWPFIAGHVAAALSDRAMRTEVAP